MNSQAMMMEEMYQPNVTLAFAAALGFHVFLLIWDPTILKASAYQMAAPMISIRMLDHLPVVQQPKPVVKPVEKKKVKKARKSGLSMQRTKHTVPVSRSRPVLKPRAAPKPFMSKITMPKFIPRESDEPMAASPLPGITESAPHPMTQALAPMPILVGKSHGIRAGDIAFKLSDRSALAGSAGRIVSIPIGEEQGDTAVLPSAPVMHEAPAGAKAIAGYRFTPGLGAGSGELAGKDRHAVLGYHGAVAADAYVEGSLAGATGDGKGGRVVAGKGFEIGGPVGDRKIIHRRLPEYPSWAEEKGIIASVKIYFTVRADGSLRSNVRIMQSSGYAELDTLAKEALLQWKFSPTSDDSTVESAWGVITFRFTLA
jgi:TonB family protein